MAAVQVLSAPGCAGCARAKELITKVLEEFPALEWEEIDLAEHPEVAAEYGIVSVPAVLIDGRLEFVGVPKEQALRERLRALAVRR